MNAMPDTGAATPSLLPFCEEVAAAVRAHKTVNVRLFACRPDPWPAALEHRASFGLASTLVLPPDADPLVFAWPPLTNVIVDITGLPDDTVQTLARALVRDGLRLGYMLDRQRPERDRRVIRKGKKA